MLGLFLLGLISKRAKNPAAVTGVVMGLIVIVWMTFSPRSGWPAAWAQWRSPFHSFMVIVFGTMTILLVGLLVSRWSKGDKSNSDKTI
jgi:SSS family solute:Na+ symporter